LRGIFHLGISPLAWLPEEFSAILGKLIWAAPQGHVMDVKTVLLLGIGMVILLLIGLCTAPSQSADLFVSSFAPSLDDLMLLAVFPCANPPVPATGHRAQVFRRTMKAAAFFCGRSGRRLS
jgi:hypothetical protein